MFLTPLFKLMQEKNASDLFFTTGAPIQIKINGTAMPLNAQLLDGSAVKRIAYEMMSEQQVREFEDALEMNFSYRVPDVGNFRINVFRQRGCVAKEIRYVNAEVPHVDDLRLPGVLKDLIMEKRGLILVVGATGSGKSTTLAAMLEHRNRNKTGHIRTIEDPLEFIVTHKKSIVNQREMRIDTQSFHNALINAMREAPDVLMIGEIRDRTTLENALVFAQTGHLCLATLHANNSYNALNRIINFFPRDARDSLLMDLSISLRCVVSQRLVKSREGKLIPAVEVLLNTRHIAELVRSGEIDQIKEAMEKSMSPGSQTFEQALLKLHLGNVVSLEEALANSDSPTNLSWLINNAKGQPPPPQESKATSDSLSPERRTSASDLSEFQFNLDVV
jgi:twitching motility protein PilU